MVAGKMAMEGARESAATVTTKVFFKYSSFNTTGYGMFTEMPALDAHL